MLKVKQFVFNPFSENTYILYSDSENPEAVIIDPGMMQESENLQIVEFLDTHKLNLKRMLLTHCHIDHVLGCRYISEKYNLPPELHQKDLVTYRQMTPAASQMYGIPYQEAVLEPKFFTEKDQITIDSHNLEIRFTPGHAPGHVVFVNHQDRYVINGDVLFEGSIGRTDFPNCSHTDLIQSIKRELLSLDDDFTVYTGHGNPTTVGKERVSNPFLK